MYIKIYSKSQMVLLRQINGLLGKYRIPKEVIYRVDRLLEERLGTGGFIAIFLDPVEDDDTEVKDCINLYPLKARMGDDVIGLNVRCTKRKMTKGREWYIDNLKIKALDSQIFVIYAMTKKVLYGREG